MIHPEHMEWSNQCPKLDSYAQGILKGDFDNQWLSLRFENGEEVAHILVDEIKTHGEKAINFGEKMRFGITDYAHKAIHDKKIHCNIGGKMVDRVKYHGMRLISYSGTCPCDGTIEVAKFEDYLESGIGAFKPISLKQYLKGTVMGLHPSFCETAYQEHIEKKRKLHCLPNCSRFNECFSMIGGD